MLPLYYGSLSNALISSWQSVSADLLFHKGCHFAVWKAFQLSLISGLPVVIDQWKWDWIVNTIKGVFVSSVGSVAVHEFQRKKKSISLCSNASSESIVQKWMRFETSDQLVALKYLLGSFCLFRVCERLCQGTSVVVKNASLCTIIPRIQ